MQHIDHIDKQIINLLGQNSRLSISHISKEVFLTSPAVAARIEKLEKSGIITGYRANLDTEKLGYPITAFVEITIEPENQSSFKDFIATIPNVLECYHVAGPYSMIMKVCFQTPSLLDKFVGSLQSYGKTQTQIAFSTVVTPREISI